MLQTMNPPGIWEDKYSQWSFQNSSIMAVYGVVVPLDEVTAKREGVLAFYWEARVMLNARPKEGTPRGLPIRGYAPTLEAAKKIVETLLWETQTCQKP